MRLAGLLLVLIAMGCLPRCMAGVITLGQKQLCFDFDDATGAIVEIRYDKHVLAHGGVGDYPVSIATGSADEPVWLDSTGMPAKLIRQAHPEPNTLVLTISAGDYEFVETYKLHDQLPRIDRSVKLTNRGPDTVKLRNLAFRTPGIITHPGGFTRFPGAWPPVSHPFDSAKVTWHGSTGTIAPGAIQLSDGLTILFASYTDDTPNLAIGEGQESAQVQQQVSAQGFLKPGVPQDIGFVTMQVVPKGYWDALPTFWDWMDSVGLRVPADRPDWVSGAVLYGFHPGGTIASSFKDLGGFEQATERLLPDVPKLGVTGVWVLPIESESPYWPKDYYSLMKGIGTFEQYKAMVARAHQLGLHVLQDLVPHGGSPKAIHNIQHPEFMLRREDGTNLDYWLNDFANADWQKYIAGVARHYVKDFDVDGYRIDACYGSREANWSPDISYSRASLAGLHGGLGMVSGIRAAVEEIKPRDGAVLAEVESARHAAVSDMQYDFSLCYNVLQQWSQLPADQFAAQLQNYLEERKYTFPRDTLMMRHVESHDSLRAQLWYGVEGMRAMYALTAWIDGVPLIYQNMDIGSSNALSQINAIRRERPEIGRGEALYHAVQCDTPGVFTCLRKHGESSSVVVINFTRTAVEPHLTWPAGAASVRLPPLGYAVVSAGEQATSPQAQDMTWRGAVINVTDPYPLTGATEWFVDTLEGRLRDTFTHARTSGNTTARDGIYWRDQIPSLLWRGDVLPLNPAQPQIGYRTADGIWHVLSFKDSDSGKLRLVERYGDKEGLFIVGGVQSQANYYTQQGLPPEAATGFSVAGGPTLRCVGNELIVNNRNYTVTLRRQGGLLRQLDKAGASIRPSQDFYGDQKAFELSEAKTINASFDAECGTHIWLEGSDLHLRFSGQLRGKDRFALKQPPIWYYSEYVLGAGKTFRQYWGFCSEGEISGQPAFLSALLSGAVGDTFRFSREGAVVAEGKLRQESGRQVQMAGKPLPDQIQLLRDGKPLYALKDIQYPPGVPVNVFSDTQNLFLTLLDATGTMDRGRWYEFSCTWEP